MSRRIFVTIITILSIFVIAEGADARGNEQKRKSKAKKPAISQEIAPALGELSWGMSEEKVIKLLERKIHEHYNRLVSQTKDAVEDDRLRTIERNKIAQLRKSRVRFDGRSTGWDLGFIRDEFTHHNGESMLVMKEDKSQSFYFFFDGRLWKWYKALNIKVFEGKDFQLFSEAMQRRFGNARHMKGELIEGKGIRNWLEWEDRNTRLRAIDQTAFYGFYCLVFEEKKTLKNLASLRRNQPKADRASRKHALVESVIKVDDTTGNADESPDIVDRITGKVRGSHYVPRTQDQGHTSRSKVSSPEIQKSDDPLDGLDFL